MKVIKIQKYFWFTIALFLFPYKGIGSIEIQKDPKNLFMTTEIIKARDMEGIPQASPTSYWDETILLNQDYIIIGAGIIGLSTAVEIKKADPEAKVLVLEKGTLASGASTRNAGFACFGSLTEIYEDISVMGAEKAIAQVKDRWQGLKDLREALSDQSINFRQTGNYEIIGQDLLPLVNQMKYVNKLLRPIFNDNVFLKMDEKLSDFGFSKNHVSSLILNKFEGQINSGKMMEALQKKAQSLGVIVRYGSAALRPYKVGDKVHVSVLTSNNSSQKQVTFKASAIGICTNGFISELAPEVNIFPGRGQILVTEPIKDTLLPTTPFHIGKGFWYFRLLDDNRILLGGGRNLNISGETTKDLRTTPDIIGPLKKILCSIIVPGQNPNIDFVWSGIMGFSEEHTPIIKYLPNLSNVVIGFGCNGMGIARGYDTGKKTAVLMIKAKKGSSFSET